MAEMMCRCWIQASDVEVEMKSNRSAGVSTFNLGQYRSKLELKASMKWQSRRSIEKKKKLFNLQWSLRYL